MSIQILLQQIVALTYLMLYHTFHSIYMMKIQHHNWMIRFFFHSEKKTWKAFIQHNSKGMHLTFIGQDDLCLKYILQENEHDLKFIVR